MTRRVYESKLKMRGLTDAALRLAYVKDGTNAMMAFPPYLVPACLPPPLDDAVEEISHLRVASVVGVMVNILPPGVTVPVHSDPLPRHYPHGGKVERWHLCIHSDLKAWLAEGDGLLKETPYPGFWYGPLRYWLPHQVGNDGETGRIHIIVDLDKEGPL